eukprot:Lankesteria_metandrocarpae@DN6140_c0_g1_i1.p1
MTKDGGSLGSNPVIRSRTWSADITKNWNKPASELESVADRANRYGVYFTLESDQLTHLMNKFLAEIELGMKLHSTSHPMGGWASEECSLKLLDSCVSQIPTGKEQGVAYALDFGGTNLRAVRVRLEGGGKVSLSQEKRSLLEAAPDLPNGLLDKNATASRLFDNFADTIKNMMVNSGDGSKWVNVGFTFSFPIDQKSLRIAHLIGWTKEFETGRLTADPVEGMDVGALLDQAFWRREVTAKQSAVLNDTVGTLLSCAYLRSPSLPLCMIGVILGTGVNGCYFQDDANEYGYKGKIINTELGAFDKGLPINDVDLEVDYASAANRGKQMFEKMVSGKYVGEICRRLVVKVYQKAAPELAWSRDSMPSEACSIVLKDKGELLETGKILEALWEWKTSRGDRQIVKNLFTMVFDRSAALSAALIAGMAKRTRRLQPAMGGLTVGIDGSLYTQNPWYAERLRHHLDGVLGKNVSDLVHITVASDGSGVGAGILAAVQSAPK